MINQIKTLIQNNKEHDDEVETGQPVDLTTIQQAETILGISFPNSYKIFLQHFGWLGMMGGGAGICGMFPNQVDTSGDVVCFTKYLRDDIDLPHHFIALEFDEGDLVICIDCSQFNQKTQEAPIYFFDPGRKSINKLNNSFKDYLIEYLTAGHNNIRMIYPIANFLYYRTDRYIAY